MLDIRIAIDTVSEHAINSIQKEAINYEKELGSPTWRKNIVKYLASELGANPRDDEYLEYMVNQEGSSNKFHLFGVFKTDDSRYIGGNAYGRIGKTPRVKKIAMGGERVVFHEVEKKARQKARKGYEITDL